MKILTTSGVFCLMGVIFCAVAMVAQKVALLGQICWGIGVFLVPAGVLIWTTVDVDLDGCIRNRVILAAVIYFTLVLFRFVLQSICLIIYILQLSTHSYLFVMILSFVLPPQRICYLVHAHFLLRHVHPAHMGHHTVPCAQRGPFHERLHLLRGHEPPRGGSLCVCKSNRARRCSEYHCRLLEHHRRRRDGLLLLGSGTAAHTRTDAEPNCSFLLHHVCVLLCHRREFSDVIFHRAQRCQVR